MNKIKENEINAISQTIKYLTDDVKKTVVDKYMKVNNISEEFVNTFRDYIDVNTFSNAYAEFSVIEQNKDLFDLDTWIKSNNKCFDLIFDEDFNKSYYMTDEQIADAIMNTSPLNITKGKLDDIKAIGVKSTAAYIYKSGSEVLAEYIKSNDNSALTDIILANRNILTKPDYRGIITNSKLDDILSGEIDIDLICKSLLSTNDIGWQNKVIKNFESGVYNINSDTYNADTRSDTIMRTLSAIDSNKVELFLNALIREKIINQGILIYALTKLDDLSEDFCLNNVAVFQEYNLCLALFKYAKERGYESVMAYISI